MSFNRVDKAARLDAEGLLENRFGDRPTRLCIDETSQRRGQIYNTVISDPDHPRLLDLVETRNQRPVQDFLASLPDDVRAGIHEVCIDMFEPYRKAVSAALGHARIFCDPFHVQRLGSKALDKVRRQLQRAPGGEWWKRPLFRVRHKLLRGPRRLRVIDVPAQRLGGC